MSSNTINIYTDGAAKGNPGPGGYGIVLSFNGKEREISEGFELTTNNRMELLAVIVALKALKTAMYPVTIYTDSKYVSEAINQGWLSSWIKKNFKGKKNEDLWKMLVPLLKKYNPKFVWIKGHAGHPQNERCDRLAVDASNSIDLKKDSGYLASIAN